MKITILAALVFIVSFIPVSYVRANDNSGATNSQQGAATQDQAEEDKLHSDTFFCTTRYGRNIDEFEEERRASCQEGYDGKDCEEKSKENEIKEACEAGRDADKPIPEEPETGSLPPEPVSSPVAINTNAMATRCGTIDTAYLICPPVRGAGISGSSLWALLTVVVNIAAALVVIVAIGSFVFSGYIYASAGDDSGKVSQSKTIIKNTLFGLVIFVLFYAIVQYIIPGGLF